MSLSLPRFSPASPVFRTAVRTNVHYQVTPRILPKSNASGIYSTEKLPATMPARKKNEKTPMEFIAEVPPIEVEGNTAVCDGGHSACTAQQHSALTCSETGALPPPSPPLPHLLLCNSGGVCVHRAGGGPLGHPIEYLQLNKVKENEPETCKYCGLRFIKKGGHH